jgi:hypothetical protein
MGKVSLGLNGRRRDPEKAILQVMDNISKLVNLARRIAQRIQHTRLRPTKPTLGPNNGLFERRRSAYIHLDIALILLRLTQSSRLQDLTGDIALLVRRAWFRARDDKRRLEPARKLPLQRRKLVTQKDILVRVDAPDEADASAVVGRVAQDAARELPHGRDARAAGQERHVRVLVRCPGERLERGHGQTVAYFQRVQVRALLAARVVLDCQFQEAGLV